MLQRRPAQFQEQSLLRVEYGGFSRRDAEEGGVEAVSVLQYTACRHEVRTAANLLRHAGVEFMRRKVANAFAVGQQVVPERVQGFGPRRAHRHAHDGNAFDGVVGLKAPRVAARVGFGQQLGQALHRGPVVDLRHTHFVAQLLESGHEAQHQQRLGPQIKHIGQLVDVAQAE